MRYRPVWIAVAILPACLLSCGLDMNRIVGSSISQIRVSSPVLDQFFAESTIVLANSSNQGNVVPVIDGVQITLKERAQTSATSSRVLQLGPGEQYVMKVGTSWARPINIIFKYYAADGTFVGASNPKQVYIPARPATVQQTVYFALSDLRQ